MSSTSSATGRGAVLRADQVAFSYGRRQVLRDVSLDVFPGEFLALAGCNGAGKTTLLHLLTGYLTPDAGTVTLEGEPVADLPRQEVARRIAYVPQRSATVFPFRVEEMVLMGRQPYAGLAAFDTEEDCQTAAQALDEVGLGREAGRRLFEELSGGERQLVLIARALAQQASILILDEPATYLDLRRQWEVMQLLERRRAGGATIIATFHDLNLAARWATRIALLHEGRMAAVGTAREVLRTEILEPVYGITLRVEHRDGRPPLVELPEAGGPSKGIG